MRRCSCDRDHRARRIVLTGGPGAGKTAVLELVRQALCEHVHVLPEAASLLFSGGFPRGPGRPATEAAQRAIFYVQRELERGLEDGHAIVLCDRGTLDGLAYWPGGAASYFRNLATTRKEQLARYHAVIHLRVPTARDYRLNGLRTESASAAARIDARIARAWDDHPNRYFVESRPEFMEKAREALGILRAYLPACCREQELGSLRAAHAVR